MGTSRDGDVEVGEHNFDGAHDGDEIPHKLRLDVDDHRLSNAVHGQIARCARRNGDAARGCTFDVQFIGEREDCCRVLGGAQSSLHGAWSRRESSVFSVVRSTTISVAVTRSPTITSVPLTAPVRPTAVKSPMRASSSLTRKPTNEPVASSRVNVPVSASTSQLPSTPATASAGASAATASGLDSLSLLCTSSDADAVTASGAGSSACACWATSTAASRLTSSARSRALATRRPPRQPPRSTAGLRPSETFCAGPVMAGHGSV